MISPREKEMLKDFGFKDYSDLNKYFNILKFGKSDRSKVYSFKWRLTMMSKYKNFNSPIKTKIIKFHTGYEDYVFKSRSGRNAKWPQRTLKQYSFLFKQLQNPWHIDNTYKRKRLYSISDPKKKLWFRAISYHEMIEALNICYNNASQFGTKTKIKKYQCGLKWSECISSYSNVRNNHSRFYPGMTPKDYDIALLICDNITSTWDSKTGHWKPWNKSNKWLIKAFYAKKYIDTNSLRNKSVKFKDVANFVRQSALRGNSWAFFMLGAAFAAGGTRAARVIKQFANKKGLDMNSSKTQNKSQIPENTRTARHIKRYLRHTELFN